MADCKVNVFISATTRDFGSYRQIVRDELLTAGYFPVVQEHFRPDSRSLIGFLERTIAECDVMVCLLGPSIGDGLIESQDVQRSFTQIEYDTARRFKKTIYAFVASDGCPLDNPPQGTPIDLQLQHQHIQNVMNEVKCDFFESPQILREKILRLALVLPRSTKRITPPEPYFIHRPKEPPFFTGRKLELNQLSLSIAQPTPCIVAVLGIGGQGKTTVVWEWFKRNGTSTFAGAIWCTAYRNGYTFDMFLDDALTYLMGDNFDKRQFQDSDARLRRLMGFLQASPYLLVIDGMERWLRGWATDEGRQLADEREDRAASQACLDDFLDQVSSVSNGTHVVFTSRALPASLDNTKFAVVPVDAEGRHAMLEGLDDEAAVYLLKEAGVQGAAEDLIPVVHRYNNHPLALSVLGSLVVEAYGGRIDHLSEVSALDQKKRLFELFEETRVHLPRQDLLVRYLAVAAHFIENPSFQPLAAVLASEAEQLGMSESPDMAKKDLRDVTVTLAKWNLIGWDASEEVVQLHPLIKEYFSNQAKDYRQIHGKLSQWYAEQPITPKVSTLNQVKTRLLAIEHALRAKNMVRCLDLIFLPCAEIRSFAEWLATWGHLNTGIDLLARLASASPCVDGYRFSISKGAMLRQTGKLHEAVAVLTEVINNLEAKWLWSFGRYRIDLCGALINRGNAQRELGELGISIINYDAALKCIPELPWERSGITAMRADVVSNKANVLRDFGHLSRAVAASSTAIDIYQRLIRRGFEDFEPGLASAFVNRANAYADGDKYTEAMRDYDAAESQFRSLLERDRKEFITFRLAHLRVMKGATLTDSGRLSEAIAALDPAVAELRTYVDAGRSDLLPFLGLAWMNLGRALFLSKEISESLQNLDQAVRVFDRFAMEGRKDLIGWLMWSLLDRAEARHHAGDTIRSQSDRVRGFQILHEMLHGDGFWVFRSSLIKKSFQSLKYLYTSSPVEAARILQIICCEVTESIRLSQCTEKLMYEVRKGIMEVREVFPFLQNCEVVICELEQLNSQMNESNLSCSYGTAKKLWDKIMRRFTLRDRRH